MIQSNEIKENNQNNEEYIKFAKLYIEKTIIERLKLITQDENLTFESTLKNDYRENIKLKDEINEFIDVLGDELIKDFDSLSNKIDDYFFDYKIDEIKELEKTNKINELKSETNELEVKFINKIDNTNLEENKKKSFIDFTKAIFSDLKEKLNNFLNKNIENSNKNDNLILDDEMKIELLSSKELSSSILNKLANDNDVSILRKIANHKNADNITLEKIFSKTNDFKVLENLLNNPNTPTSIVDILAQNTDKDISLMALKHVNLSEKILLKNCKTENKEIINNILKNENITEEMLQNISVYNIKNEEILKKVINHPACSENLNTFINEKLDTSQSTKKSIKDKIKEKQDIINKNKQEKMKQNTKQEKNNTNIRS